MKKLTAAILSIVTATSASGAVTAKLHCELGGGDIPGWSKFKTTKIGRSENGSPVITENAAHGDLTAEIFQSNGKISGSLNLLGYPDDPSGYQVTFGPLTFNQVLQNKWRDNVPGGLALLVNHGSAATGIYILCNSR